MMNVWIKRMVTVVLVLSGFLALSGLPAAAEPLRIVIDEFSSKAQPIAIAPFVWTGTGNAPDVDIAGMIEKNMRRTGFFEPIPSGKFLALPTFGVPVSFGHWRAIGADYLVVGRLMAETEAQFILEYELFDVYKGSRLAGYQVPTPKHRLHSAVHFVSDLIYQDLTGRRGVFNTRIATVKVHGENTAQSRYELIIADADGNNAHVQLASTEPIMSPAWSPDRRRLAYVSFQNDRPEIFVKEVASNRVEKIASFAGINGAPAWSPDGASLAFVLSRDGNPEIYVRDLKRPDLLRVTFNQAIDTEPSWSPDGKTLVFTSDRGGGTQLYMIDALGGQARRLTAEGSYNASGRFSPDGKSLTFVHRDERGHFRIALMDLESRRVRLLTQGPMDESPSFAPNGDMIVYTAKDGLRSVLMSISRNGRGQTVIAQDADYRQPAWGAFLP